MRKRLHRMAFSAVFLRSVVVSGFDRFGIIDLPLVPEARKVGASTRGRGADRPEAYPTGNEKPEGYPTGNENRRADTQLGWLIRPEGSGVEQMSYTNLCFLVIVKAFMALHLFVLFRALRLYRGFGSCPPHFIFRMNKLARCCRCFG